MNRSIVIVVFCALGWVVQGCDDPDSNVREVVSAGVGGWPEGPLCGVENIPALPETTEIHGLITGPGGLVEEAFRLQFQAERHMDQSIRMTGTAIIGTALAALPAGPPLAQIQWSMRLPYDPSYHRYGDQEFFTSLEEECQFVGSDVGLCQVAFWVQSTGGDIEFVWWDEIAEAVVLSVSIRTRCHPMRDNAGRFLGYNEEDDARIPLVVTGLYRVKRSISTAFIGTYFRLHGAELEMIESGEFGAQLDGTQWPLELVLFYGADLP